MRISLRTPRFRFNNHDIYVTSKKKQASIKEKIAAFDDAAVETDNGTYVSERFGTSLTLQQIGFIGFITWKDMDNGQNQIFRSYMLKFI